MGLFSRNSQQGSYESHINTPEDVARIRQEERERTAAHDRYQAEMVRERAEYAEKCTLRDHRYCHCH